MHRERAETPWAAGSDGAERNFVLEELWLSGQAPCAPVRQAGPGSAPGSTHLFL